MRTVTSEVLALIEAERRTVRSEVASEADDDNLADRDWGALILRHAGLGMPHSGPDDADEGRFLRQMVRTAWLAIAAAEATIRRQARAEG